MLKFSLVPGSNTRQTSRAASLQNGAEVFRSHLKVTHSLVYQTNGSMKVNRCAKT